MSCTSYIWFFDTRNKYNLKRELSPTQINSFMNNIEKEFYSCNF